MSIRRHLWNLGANWFAQLAGIVVFFFLSPFIAHTLGKAEYYLWGLLNLVTGCLGALDLGVRASAGRYVTLYLGAGDHERVDQTLRTGVTFYSFLALGLLAIAGALGWAFPWLFRDMPAGYHAMVQVLLPLLALNLWLSAMRAIFASVLNAHDRFDLSQGVDLGVLAITTVATVLALRWGLRIAALAGIAVAAGAIGAVANVLIARRVYPRLRLLPPAVHRDRLKELFSFGIPALLGNLATKFLGQADAVLVGILFGFEAGAVYWVGCQLLYYTWPFVEQIQNTLFPSIQRSVGAGDWDSVRYAGVRLMKLSLIAGLAMLLGFICLGDRFIRLWMGPEYAEAAVVMALLAVSRIVQLIPQCEITLLYAEGRIWFLTTMGLVESAVIVGSALVLASKAGVGLGFGAGLGLAGVAAAPVVARALLAPVYVWYGYQRTQLRVGSIARHALVPGACVAAAFVGWCLLVRWLVPGGRWAWFAVQVVVALLGYAVFAGALLVPRSDWARLWRRLGLAPAAGPREGAPP
jgi:O-antigen/teichoic acid export membrane protein